LDHLLTHALIPIQTVFLMALTPRSMVRLLILLAMGLGAVVRVTLQTSVIVEGIVVAVELLVKRTGAGRC